MGNTLQVHLQVPSDDLQAELREHSVMAGERHLSDAERKRLQKRAWAIRESLRQPGEEVLKVSWQRVRDAICAPGGEKVSQESVRKLGEDADGGIKLARLIDGYQLVEAPVPAQLFVEKEERYPSVAIAFARSRYSTKIDPETLEKVHATVRLKVGFAKGLEPTVEQVEQMIRDELNEVPKVQRFYDADDIDREVREARGVDSSGIRALPKRRKA